MTDRREETESNDTATLLSCPICFREEKEEQPCDTTFQIESTTRTASSSQQQLLFAYNPGCRHVFCVDCLERWLLQTTSSSQNAIPTYGVCPICRTSLSFFDLVSCETHQRIHTTIGYDNMIPSKLRNALFTEYVEANIKGSIQFSNDGDIATLSLKREQSIRVLGRESESLTFCENQIYHAPSHTWQAETRLPDMECSSMYRLILNFSSNFASIRRGILLSTPITAWDGIWSLVLVDKESQCISDLFLPDSIRIHHGSFSSDGMTKYTITFHLDEMSVFLIKSNYNQNSNTMTESTVVAMAVIKYKISQSQSTIPSVVDRLVWRSVTRQLKDVDGASDNNDGILMEWTRKEPSLLSSTRVAFVEMLHFGGGEGPLLLRTNPNFVSVVPNFNRNSMWGNTFYQNFELGLASYHFVAAVDEDEEENTSSSPQVYISYESPRTYQWPNLDNGAPIPSRVYFRNITFPTSHTFRGHICWLQDHGTPWQGMVRWEYEMEFSPDFMFIQGGVVHSVSTDDFTIATSREMSRYGQELNYVNAALSDEFNRQLIGTSPPFATLSSSIQRCRERISNSRTDMVQNEIDIAVEQAFPSLSTNIKRIVKIALGNGVPLL